MPKIFRIFESTRLTGLAFLIAGRCTDVDGWIKISLGIIGAVFFSMGYRSAIEESR